MQVWDIAVFHTDENNKPFFSFEFNNIKYVVTAEIMKKALHLPKHGTITPTKLTNDELLDFLKTLGYASDATKIGSLQRSLGKKEWNFFFDNISRCLLNKVSNFDALPSGSLQIGYSLIRSITLFLIIVPFCLSSSQFERRTKRVLFVTYAFWNWSSIIFVQILSLTMMNYCQSIKLMIRALMP